MRSKSRFAKHQAVKAAAAAAVEAARTSGYATPAVAPGTGAGNTRSATPVVGVEEKEKEKESVRKSVDGGIEVEPETGPGEMSGRPSDATRTVDDEKRE